MKQLSPPSWAENDKVTAMKERAGELVQVTREKSGPALTRVVDGLGGSAQKKMGEANDLMSKNVGSLLKGLDGKSPTGEKLLELRSTMDELNPHSLHNAWWFSWMPKAIKRKAVTKFIRRYEPMQSHVGAILNGLRAGKDELLEMSLSLEAQYDEIMAAKKEIESEIYIGELFIEKIEEREAETPADDILETQKLASVKNQAARRVRDLRTMEQAAVQFFISIDQTIATNTLLGEQIDSALTVGPMVMNNALRIQAALAQQKSVKEAVKGFQDGLGEMMSQNASAVNQAASDIGDMYNNPVISLEKLEEGFDQLMQAVNKANETMASSTVKAREASASLESMTEKLAPVAEGMRQSRESAPSDNTRISQQAEDAEAIETTKDSTSGNNPSKETRDV